MRFNISYLEMSYTNFRPNKPYLTDEDIIEYFKYAYRIDRDSICFVDEKSYKCLLGRYDICHPNTNLKDYLEKYFKDTYNTTLGFEIIEDV